MTIVTARKQRYICASNPDSDCTDHDNFDLQEEFRWLADYLATELGDDWYLSNTVGGFRVRCSIDVTEGQVLELVINLLQTFESAVLAESGN